LQHTRTPSKKSLRVLTDVENLYVRSAGVQNVVPLSLLSLFPAAPCLMAEVHRAMAAKIGISVNRQVVIKRLPLVQTQRIDFLGRYRLLRCFSMPCGRFAATGNDVGFLCVQRTHRVQQAAQNRC
jgi:hypothetical protein